MDDTTAPLDALTVLQKAAMLSGRNTWQTRAIAGLGISSIRLADGPHGVRKQLGSADHLGLAESEPATCFPTAATVANSWDVDLAQEIGTALGREAASQGVDVLLGPGLNIKRSPLGGRNFEYFSEDPELSGRLAAATVRGIQSAGVAATPKHFAANSQELRRMVSDSVVDERTLRELYLSAFEIVVRESTPWALMSSYNLVNGTYAHENRRLLTDILRGEWGFDGVVVSDWGGSDDAVAAVRSGGTLEMPSPGFDSARQIVSAIERRELAESDLDARVAELLALIRRVMDRDEPAIADYDAHHALARRAAAESAVLLRNEGALLPLAAGTTVALVGDFAAAPRFQGAGSSSVNPTRVSTLSEAIADTSLVLAGVAQGFRRDEVPDPQLVAEAVALAATADVVVLALGLPEVAESEGFDRDSLDLPPDQVALLEAVSAANPRTVVVLSAGGPVTTPWLARASALVHAYLGGQAGAEGILDVLTGAVDPGGRLAETFPLALADTPTAGRFPSAARTAEYREGLYVGYRYYDTAGVPVAFPFGFGLSYTRFAWSDLRVEGGAATLTVTNEGTRAGSTVAQLYVRRQGPSRVYRPRQELKGFAKVRLAPGEAIRVSIPLGERTFRFFDASADRWSIEGGSYVIAVGPDIADLPLTAVVHQDGDEGTRSMPVPVPDSYRRAAVREISDTDFAALLGGRVPAATWGSGPLHLNDPIARLETARGWLGRLLFRLLDGRRRTAESEGRRDLDAVFVLNAPFRAIFKMSGGRATRGVADAFLVAVNGRTLRGLANALTAYLRGRVDERSTRRAVEKGRDEGAVRRRR